MYDKICNFCGKRLSEFYETGMLGCPHCYKAFEKQVVSTLYKIQGKTFHVGKTPYNLSEEDRYLLSRYKTLLTEKERATLEGRFSDIRGLTKELLEISSKLKSRGII